MLGFLVIGVVGLVLLGLSLVLGEILEGVFSAFDVEFGGGVFSTPVIGSFLAAFGFGAALTMYAAGIGATGGAFSGLASGVVVGGLALLITRSLINMPTDATPAAGDLAGARGTVVTAIPADGYGEVSVASHGSVLKRNARGTQAIPSGQAVVVVDVLSASSVLVRPVDTDPDARHDDPTDRDDHDDRTGR